GHAADAHRLDAPPHAVEALEQQLARERAAAATEADELAERPAAQRRPRGEGLVDRRAYDLATHRRPPGATRRERLLDAPLARVQPVGDARGCEAATRAAAPIDAQALTPRRRGGRARRPRRSGAGPIPARSISLRHAPSAAPPQAREEARQRKR